MYRMYGIPQGARDGGAVMYRMYGLKIAPCIFRTSHFHVGRIPQGARDGGAVVAIKLNKSYA